jgi:hypothetical protein
MCRRTLSRVVLAAWVVSLGTAGSCTAPVFVVTAGLSVAQLGTAAYANGALKSATIVSADEAVAAAEAAIAGLELSLIRKTVSGRKTLILSEEMGGRNVSIEIIKKTERFCTITIRVGVFGDQAVSRLVLAEVQKELEARDPSRRPNGSGEVPLIYVPELDDEP